MDEDISIINSNTRNEKIKNFFINNKKQLISIISVIILIIFAYFVFGEYKDKKRIKIAEKYNSATLKFNPENTENIKTELIEIINERDASYSPLALYFIIDNEMKFSNEEINKYFDILINETKLEKEIKNLIIYKKGLFNSEFESENNLISILNPLVNSNSIWKSHALYLLAEFFLSKGQMQKAKEFYNQILTLEKGNEDLKLEAKKRLLRNFSE